MTTGSNPTNAARLGSGVGTGATVAGGVGIYELALYFGLEAIPALAVAGIAGLVAGSVAQWARDVLAWRRDHSDQGGPPTLGTLMMRILATLGVLVLCFGLGGCAGKMGPGEYGWASWDLCGYEGGVASELTVMGTNTWTLGCTTPPAKSDQLEDLQKIQRDVGEMLEELEP